MQYKLMPMNSGFVACGCQLIPLSGSAQRETIGIGPIVECKHFRHPADEQLRILDISSSNNLPSVLFDFIF